MWCLCLTFRLQARVAALLKEHPSAGQAFCRLLVAPYLHYIEGGKGEENGNEQGRSTWHVDAVPV